MAKTKGRQREKTKTSRIPSSKSSQATTSSKCSSDRQTTEAGRMRNRKKSGAELYKTRHNIGKRSAAGRVASYRETEVALLFPDGFFRPVVKVETTSSEKDGGGSMDDVQTPSKSDHVMVESKSKQSSESSESIKKPLLKSCSESSSSKSKVLHKTTSKTAVKKKNTPKPASAERKSGEENKKALNEVRSSKETTRTAKEKGKLVKGCSKSTKGSQSEGSPKKFQDTTKQHVDSEASLLQVSSPKDTTNDSKSGQATKRKDNESKNKNTLKKPKGANQSSEVSSAKVSKYFGLQPRAPRIKRTACLNAGAIMSAMYRDTPVVKKPKMDALSVHIPAVKSSPKQSPKKQEVDKPQTEKVTSPKKVESKKNYTSSSNSNLKKTSHLDINKKVKVKMKAKERVKSRPCLIKKGKKVKVEESSEEESEKEEEHIPLWPPPRRMASLNAQAILAACTEDRIKRPRAESTPKIPRRQSVKQQKQVKAADTSEKCDNEHHEPVAEKTMLSKPEDNEMESEASVKSSESNTSVTQSLPVSSSSLEQTASSKTKLRQEPATEPPSKPNLPNQSPDVQILEVKPPSYSGSSVSRMNVGGYTSHNVPHARQTQGPVAFMPSSSSSFSYAAPSGHGSHGNQARYPGVPVQQPIPPHAPSGYTLQQQTQRAYQSTHMAYPTQAPQHGQTILPSPAQQKMYAQGHQQAQGQHLGHGPYPGHPQTRHRAPLASQSQSSFQQQQQQQQPQQHQPQQQQQQQQAHHHHHHQLAPYQPSLTPHSSQNMIVQQSQSYHHHNYPIQQSHQAPTMPVLGHHAMSSGTIYPGGIPMSVTKPKIEPRCSTPAQRFQAVGPKPEKPLMSYPTMPGSQGQHGSAPNHPHGPSPMGNTCTYPYPHSNHGNTQSDQCQSYMMSSMPVDNSATCTMMSFRHFGSAFTLHSYDEQQQEHTTFGFYQPAGPLIQTMPHDPCCIPEHMAMLVPRPQVKVLVHNTGSYPATNPYAALPDSSQPPIIPTKGSGTHRMRSNSSELKEKSQTPASPTKRMKTAKDLDHDQCETVADARKENDDGKVFTTLEVATKRLKNIDGRELLAQRTKLSSDPLLLQPIISEKSSDSVQSENKINTEEPSVPVSQGSVKTSTTDNVVSSSQTQQSDKPMDKPVGCGKDTQKDITNDASKGSESESSEQSNSEDQTTKSSSSVTPTTTSVTSAAEKVPSPVSTIAAVSLAIAATSSVIDTQAKITSDLMTVVTSSVTSKAEPARSMTVSTPSSSSAVLISLPVTTEVKLTTTGTSTIAINTATPVKTPVIKRAKPAKSAKKAVLVPTTTSGPVAATAVVTMTTATMTTKSTSMQVKEASRKRKGSTSVDATAVKVSAVTSRESNEVKSADTLNKIKTKTPSKVSASKKAKCSVVSTDGGTIPASGGTVSTDSQSTAAGKPSSVSTLSTIIPPNTASAVGTIGSVVQTVSNPLTPSSSVNPILSVTQVRAMPFSSLQSVVQSSTSKTSDSGKLAGFTGVTVMSGVTGVTNTAGSKPAMVTPSSPVTPLFVSSTQKPMPDGKAGPTTAILPQGTVLLSNTGALNQPILMSAINNPAQITPGQLPLVSVPAGQVVMPVFLPAKSLAPTTGAVAMTSVATSTLTTTTASGSAVSQMKMPLLQNSFSVTQANIALSGMMPPVFLSIPQPNTMGQTFLHLGGIKPTLQQIQLPVVSHQQVVVTQAAPDIRTVATSKCEASQSAQGKKVSTSSQEPAEKTDMKEVTTKSRKKKTPKDGTGESKTKDKLKTPAKKKANKSKAESVSKVTTSDAKGLPETSLSALQATVKHQPVSTFTVSSIPQVMCSVSQVRSSTAPLLGCSSQSVHSQGKTNISHCADLLKIQTPLDMLQTVAMGGQKVGSQAKDGGGLKVTEAVDGSKPVTNIATRPGQKVDENGALDLVMLGGLASKKSDSKAKTLKRPTKAKPSTLLKSSPAQSLAPGVQTSPRPAAVLHSPPPLSHGVPAYSPGYAPSVLPLLDKTCSSTSAAAYEDLIQDLSLPRQQQSSTPTKPANTKDSINKRDPGTPIDLSKNKSKVCTKTTKSEGSKKCKKSKQATSSKLTASKSKSFSPPALSVSSNMHSSLPPSGFQYIAGIQIPVINRVPLLMSPGTKVTTGGSATSDTSRSQCVENQIVSSTTNIRSVGHQKGKGGDKSPSVSDADKQLEKTIPTKGVLSRGFQLNEVVERLHQANKELSDNSDRSDGESSPNKQKKLVSSSLQSGADVKDTKKVSQQLTQVQQHEVNIKKGGSYQKDIGTKNTEDGGDYDDDDDDDDDEDALFIDMDCDPADNKPGISCSVENESVASVIENTVCRSAQKITDDRNQTQSTASELAPGYEKSRTATCNELNTERHSETCVNEKQDESPESSATIGEPLNQSSDSSVCNAFSPECIDTSQTMESVSQSHDVANSSRNTSKPQNGTVVNDVVSVVQHNINDAETEPSIKNKDITCGLKDVAADECNQDPANCKTVQVTSASEILTSHLENNRLLTNDTAQCKSVTNESDISVTAGQDSNVKNMIEKSTTSTASHTECSTVMCTTEKCTTEKCRDIGTGTDGIIAQLQSDGTTVGNTSVTELPTDNDKTANCSMAGTKKEHMDKVNSVRKLAADAKIDNDTPQSIEDEGGFQSTGTQVDVNTSVENTKIQSEKDDTEEEFTTKSPPKTDPVIDSNATEHIKGDSGTEYIMTESRKDVLEVDDNTGVGSTVRCLPSDDSRIDNVIKHSTDDVIIDGITLQDTQNGNCEPSFSHSTKVVASSEKPFAELATREHTQSPKADTEVNNMTGELPEEVKVVSTDTVKCPKEEATLNNTGVESPKKDVRMSTATGSTPDEPRMEFSDEKQVESTKTDSAEEDVKLASPNMGLRKDTEIMAVSPTTSEGDKTAEKDIVTRLSDDSSVASTPTVLEKENAQIEITESSLKHSIAKKNLTNEHDVTGSESTVSDIAVSSEHIGVESNSGQDLDEAHKVESLLAGNNDKRGKTGMEEKVNDEKPVAVSGLVDDALVQNTDANIGEVNEGLTEDITSVDKDSKASPAQAEAGHNMESENVVNTEIAAQVKVAKSENTGAAESIVTENVISIKTDVDKNERTAVPEMTHQASSLAEEQTELKSLTLDNKEHGTGNDGCSQDMKAKEIIMAIDSLVSSCSFVDECKHSRKSTPTEVTVEDGDSERMETVENWEEVNHSGQTIHSGGTDNGDRGDLGDESERSRYEFMQEDKQYLKENRKDISNEIGETTELIPNIPIRNGNLSFGACLMEGVSEEVNHVGLQQKIIGRPVIYPGKCTQLEMMEELKIICEETDSGMGHLTSGSMRCPHSVNNIGVNCEDTDSSVNIAGIRRAHSLSPNPHPKGSNNKKTSLSMDEHHVEAALTTETAKGPNTKKSPEDNPRRTSPRAQGCLSSKKEDSTSVGDDNPRRTQSVGKRKEDTSGISPSAKRALTSPKRKDDKKTVSEQKKLSPGARKKEEKLYKPWRWEGEAELKPVYTQVEGPPVQMTCYPAIRHDDGDLIRVRDCVLVKSGPRKSDIPYVAKIGALFEDPDTHEIMMSVLWFYRAEHTETERLPRYIDNEIFASRHRDVIPAVCIDDKCYVLTFNEYCRYHGEQTRIQQCLPPRPDIVPCLDSSDLTRTLDHIPPVTASSETVFLCRRVYDVKLKRILKNPQVHIASHSAQ